MKIIKMLLFFFFMQFSAQSFAQNYLFFFHNRFLEEMNVDAIHPDYGKAEYYEILSEFKKAGFTVFSEKRASGTDISLYAKKITYQIDSLLKKGVKPNHITVVGTSKGGYIAQYVSTYLANPDVNYVFIGSYRDQDITKLPNINFCGNILNIYEASDEFGSSAIKRKEISTLKVSRFKEIELHNGLKHGFLFKARKEWIKPVISWGKRDYNKV